MTAVALHEKIRANIEKRILSGAWRPGYRIPFEHELMEQYDCARMTVNKAIASLVDSGLIVRRRRAGSFVTQPKIHSAVLDIPDIQADITMRGDTYGLQLLARRKRLARNSSQNEVLFSDASILVLRCLHLANGQPFALEDRLINLAAVPGAIDVDFGVIAPGTWLLTHVPWTEAEHRITATNVDNAVALLLNIGRATACLQLDRRTWRGPENITQVRQIFPGGKYDLTARFGPRA